MRTHLITPTRLVDDLGDDELLRRLVQRGVATMKAKALVRLRDHPRANEQIVEIIG